MKFKRALSALLAAILVAYGTLCLSISARSVSDQAVAAAVVTSENLTAAALQAPTSSIRSGNYITNGIRITLSGSSKNDEIWYSLNGTGYRRYTEPLSVTQNSTIKTYLIRNGKKSSVATYTYNLIPMLSTSLKSGTYNGAQRVFLNCGVTNAKIYYTLDGSTPNERSNLYSASTGILIKTTSTLKVIAVKTGWTRYVRTYNYTINGVQDVADDPLPDGGLVIVNTPKNDKSLLDDYTSKWGYNQLNASQKEAYALLFEAATTFTYQIDVSRLNLKANDFETAYWAFDYDNPQFLALGNGYSYYYYISTGYLQKVTITYGRTYSQIMPVQQIFNATAESVINKADSQLTDYAKLKYIHDWIVNNTVYTLNGPAYKSEADGAVVYGKALCEGYSKTFMYMAQKLGFECICVVGSVDNTAHMWNMVKLNGAWYHVDATFDDPITSDGSNILTHDYFLVGTYEISKTHTINNPVSVPSAPRSY